VTIAGRSKDRKRERDSARWQEMSQEKKDERNKKRREAYRKRNEKQLKNNENNGSRS
jgi:hypothetical protein